MRRKMYFLKQKLAAEKQVEETRIKARSRV